MGYMQRKKALRKAKAIRTRLEAVRITDVLTLTEMEEAYMREVAALDEYERQHIRFTPHDIFNAEMK